MATPHVAGAWAVLKQKKPAANVTEVLNAFTSTGKQVTDARNGITKPRIQVVQALNALSGVTNYILSVTSDGTGGAHSDRTSRRAAAYMVLHWRQRTGSPVPGRGLSWTRTVRSAG